MSPPVSAAAAVRRTRYSPTFGATPTTEGVRFQVWAAEARAVRLHLDTITHDLDTVGEGIWEITVEGVRAGARYAYSLDGGAPMPDPASRCQPEGVHGWSEVVDPAAFQWTDDHWAGLDPRRAVLYELHVGTFTPEGTFAGVAAKLPYLADLGVTAIELMPLADFAGRRNWGYDGVALFAPPRIYGRPDDLRRLIDAAHRVGLAVLIDVVYNHLGPDGAYLPAFSAGFFNRTKSTPWGAAVNLDDAGCGRVRRLLTENALHWIHEYHADGLRLDATHSLLDRSDRHFVADLTAAVHAAATPRPLVYAEDHRNLAALIDEPARGGWDLDGVWADDFHHIVRRMLAGDTHGYYGDFDGDARELATTLETGWLFTGQPSRVHAAPRGTDASTVAMRKSVICVQNHDQVGNRALGDRLHHTADPAAWRAAVAVLLTAPMTPLLFMGQEWAASTPFQFFTDFNEELGRQVVDGRRQEFAASPEFSAPDARERIPDPQAAATFENSTLRWEERQRPPHAPALALHRALLRLRREWPALQGSDATAGDADALDADTLVVRRDAPDSPSVLIVACLRHRGIASVDALRGKTNEGAALRGTKNKTAALRGTKSERAALRGTKNKTAALRGTRNEGAPLGGKRWRLLLDTEDAAYAADPRPPRLDLEAGVIEFHRPGAVVLAAAALADRAADARDRAESGGA